MTNRKKFEKQMRKEGLVDMAGQPIKKGSSLYSLESLLRGTWGRKPDKIVVYLEKRADGTYYGVVYAPKEYFDDK